MNQARPARTRAYGGAGSTATNATTIRKANMNPIIRSPSYRPMRPAALLAEPIALVQAFVAAPHPGMIA